MDLRPLLLAALLLGAPASASASGASNLANFLSGRDAEAAKARNELMRQEAERVAMCNLALKNYLAGAGPAPPPMCSAATQIPAEAPQPAVIERAAPSPTMTTCNQLGSTTTCN